MRMLSALEHTKPRRTRTLKCFIGLGNPGKEYMHNRHNIGFMVLDRFAEQHHVKTYQSKGKSYIAELQSQGQKILLLKPTTYMNLSGEAVRMAMDYYKFKLEDIVVIYDDLDIPFSQLRLRLQGSAGGHNGMKSIIQHIGTPNFSRIRMGISRPMPGANIADYVLSNFNTSESKQLPDFLDTCIEAMQHSINHSFEETMGIYNRS
jgi:PTH1 family peptidyl-tRNA hydrolase